MKLEIVTPARRLAEVEASEVIVPGESGEFGVLPGHKPFLAALGTGALTYKSGSGKSAAMMISGGLCEVLEDRVNLLAEYVQPADEIDLSEAQRTLGQLESELKALPAGDDKIAPLSNKVDRWQARITVAKIR